MTDNVKPQPFFAHARTGFESMVVQPHHYSVFELTPGYVDPTGLTTHNRHGFRGADFEFEKPDDVHRIVCMGESSTYCTGIDRDAETYPARLAHHLGADPAGKRTEVINAGVPAYNSAENVIHFLFRVQPLQPDLIVYYFTHNDVLPRRCSRLSRDYREFCKVWGDPIWGDFDYPSGTWFQKLKARLPLRRAVDAEMGIGPLVRHYSRLDDESIAHNTAQFFHDNLVNLFALARHWQIDMALMLPSYPVCPPNAKRGRLLRTQAVLEHRKLGERVARSFSSPVLDLQRSVDALSPETSRDHFYSDAAHFTEAGADWAAELLASLLRDQESTPQGSSS